jgi:hypothetical protein
MGWAELLQSGNSAQPIQHLCNAANMVTLGQMSEAVLRKSTTKRPIQGCLLFHASWTTLME